MGGPWWLLWANLNLSGDEPPEGATPRGWHVSAARCWVAGRADAPGAKTWTQSPRASVWHPGQRSAARRLVH